jgi:hypothetical protein
MTSSPSYQWYPRQYFTDEKVLFMSLEERGAYRELLDRCHIEGSIPDDPAKLAVMLRIDAEHAARIWEHVRQCFEPVPGAPGRMQNAHMLRIREKAEEWRSKRSEQASKAANARWNKQRGDGIESPASPPAKPNAARRQRSSKPASDSTASARAEHDADASCGSNARASDAKCVSSGLVCSDTPPPTPPSGGAPAAPAGGGGDPPDSEIEQELRERGVVAVDPAAAEVERLGGTRAELQGWLESLGRTAGPGAIATGIRNGRFASWLDSRRRRAAEDAAVEDRRRSDQARRELGEIAHALECESWPAADAAEHAAALAEAGWTSGAVGHAWRESKGDTEAFAAALGIDPPPAPDDHAETGSVLPWRAQG